MKKEKIIYKWVHKYTYSVFNCRIINKNGVVWLLHGVHNYTAEYHEIFCANNRLISGSCELFKDF